LRTNNAFVVANTFTCIDNDDDDDDDIKDENTQIDFSRYNLSKPIPIPNQPTYSFKQRRNK